MFIYYHIWMVELFLVNWHKIWNLVNMFFTEPRDPLKNYQAIISLKFFNFSSGPTPKPDVDYCKVKCPSLSSPVCGTNNQTYNNKCSLFKWNCLNKQSVAIVAETGLVHFK